MSIHSALIALTGARLSVTVAMRLGDRQIDHWRSPILVYSTRARLMTIR